MVLCFLFFSHTCLHDVIKVTENAGTECRPRAGSSQKHSSASSSLVTWPHTRDSGLCQSQNSHRRLTLGTDAGTRGSAAGDPCEGGGAASESGEQGGVESQREGSERGVTICALL